MVGAHRAAGDSVEHLALRLRAERILDDRREDVRDAADVGRVVPPGVRPVPVLGQGLRRVVNAVGDLDRRRLDRRLAGRARTEDVGVELPGGLGLDRRADPEEAAAVVEVAPRMRPSARR